MGLVEHVARAAGTISSLKVVSFQSGLWQESARGCGWGKGKGDSCTSGGGREGCFRWQKLQTEAVRWQCLREVGRMQMEENPQESERPGRGWAPGRPPSSLPCIRGHHLPQATGAGGEGAGDATRSNVTSLTHKKHAEVHEASPHGTGPACNQDQWP